MERLNKYYHFRKRNMFEMRISVIILLYWAFPIKEETRTTVERIIKMLLVGTSAGGMPDEPLGSHLPT
jgi:hypothetical protein